MKKQALIFVLGCFMLVPITRAEESPIPVSSQIKSVTVFLKGAQVYRNGSAKIPAGISSLIFEKLPRDLNPESVQLSGTGSFTILSVSHRYNFLEDQEKSERIRDLEGRLKTLQSERSRQDGIRKVYEAEESMLLANKSVGGTQNGLETARLKEVADFFRLRLTEISNKKIELQEKIQGLDEEIQKLKNQLAQAGTAGKIPVSEILVQVSATSAQTARLELEYLVNQAGWVPSYDIRAKDITQPVSILYKAGVYQNTGEDWKNISLSLSTGNPQLSGTTPVLSPWYLNFFEPVYRAVQGKVTGVQLKSAAALDEVVEAAEMPAASSAAGYTTVSEAQTQVMFHIQLPYSIPSGGQNQSVEIQQFSVPAEYVYHTVPKLDADAFLQARITGWEKFNLLPGEMNLFFEGTYVGKSFLDPRNTKDTLDLSLGRDKSIVVKRTMLREFTKKQFLGNKVTESRNWEIELKNTKNEPVVLVVKDQYPVSANKEIEISYTDPAGAGFNKSNGILTWKLELKPGESRTLKAGFEVKYPSGKNVILD